MYLFLTNMPSNSKVRPEVGSLRLASSDLNFFDVQRRRRLMRLHIDVVNVEYHVWQDRTLGS